MDGNWNLIEFLLDFLVIFEENFSKETTEKRRTFSRDLCDEEREGKSTSAPTSWLQCNYLDEPITQSALWYSPTHLHPTYGIKFQLRHRLQSLGQRVCSSNLFSSFFALAWKFMSLISLVLRTYGSQNMFYSLFGRYHVSS